MSNKLKSLTTILCLCILLVSALACAVKTAAPAAATRTATAKVGNLTVSTSVDGNLIMPQAYNLLFGAPGDVQDVFVEEGDFVKEGTVLATLDNTSEKLGVESSNNNVQQVLSKLYENVPLLPQFQNKSYTAIKNEWGDMDFDIHGNPILYENIDGFTWVSDPNWAPTPEHPVHYLYQEVWFPGQYSYYYPNAAALSAYNFARDEVNRANRLYDADNYTAAASELYIALSDLDACMAIIQDTLNNPKSGLGNVTPLVPADEAGITELDILTGGAWNINYVVQLRKVSDSIKQGQADIQALRDLLTQGKYDAARPMFEPLIKQVNDIGKQVINSINLIKAHNYSTVYGKDLSLYFYDAAAAKLSAALKGIENGGLKSTDLNDNLRIALHYMQLCNSIMGSNDYVLQHGLSLKAEQQAHVDLQTALVGLGNAKEDFLNTVILAPFDGIVVSVGVKKNDVLSQIDYASVTAVQLVDTSQIKFQGSVDEIDILKIKAGQKATIEVDAVPDKTFTGTVSFISPFGTPDNNGVVKFPITILLDPTEVALKGGLTATADIAITTVENALLVPVSAVTTTNEGSFVTVVDKATGKQEKRQVTLGERNLQFMQVLTGLKEGDEVLIVESVSSAPIVKELPRGAGGPPPSR